MSSSYSVINVMQMVGEALSHAVPLSRHISVELIYNVLVRHMLHWVHDCCLWDGDLIAEYMSLEADQLVGFTAEHVPNFGNATL